MPASEVTCCARAMTRSVRLRNRFSRAACNTPVNSGATMARTIATTTTAQAGVSDADGVKSAADWNNRDRGYHRAPRVHPLYGRGRHSR